MTLFKNNAVNDAWYIEEDALLQMFANSEVYQDKSRDEKLRLALFICYNEPRGLQCTFYGYQFNKLWDYWCGNKFKFSMLNVQSSMKES
jgi:hypothetical protein